MGRYDRREQLATLDPETEFEEIYRQVASLEFPWDMNQSLGFALFRTYAVPTIGELLGRTGEFTERVQKRYDDTGLLLDAVLEHGMGSSEGRAAVRRMNQMHGSYSISNDDMRYVLATFVVVPARWLDDYGWRRLTPGELRASVRYYHELGRLMGMQEVPQTWEQFVDLLESHEVRTFGWTAGGRAVADATLDLMTTFPPNQLLPKRLVRTFSYALMDDRLLQALRYPRPAAPMRLLGRAAMRLRAKVVRRMRPRTAPKLARQLPQIRSYPGGYVVEELGTFPGRGCPVPHQDRGPAQAPTASAAREAGLDQDGRHGSEPQAGGPPVESDGVRSRVSGSPEGIVPNVGAAGATIESCPP